MRKSTLVCLLMGLTCLIGSYGVELPQYDTCELCTDNDGMWIEYPNCTQYCEQFRKTSGAMHQSKWRRRVVPKAKFGVDTEGDKNAYADCSVMENKCEVLSEVRDPSLEQGTNYWATSTNVDVIVQHGSDSTPHPIDGKYFAWLCGTTAEHCVGWLEQENVVIPSHAMYLSFFVYTVIEAKTLSSLTVLINNEPVYRIDVDNKKDFPNYYTNVELDVKKYANGGKANIKFIFVQFTGDSVPPEHSMAAIDYISLIKRDATISPIYNTSVIDYCSETCPKSFLEKNLCYTDCNNFMCGYSGGQCDDVAGSSSKCYSGEEPKPKSKLSTCSKFMDSSCCSDEEVTYVNKFYSSMANRMASGLVCNVDPKCDEAIKNMICAPCAGTTKDFIHDGKIEYCEDYARKAFDTCYSSYIIRNGKCVLVSGEYPNVNAWVNLFNGTIGNSEKCYSGGDIDDDDWGYLKYIIIGVIALVVLILIITIIAVCVTVASHRKLKKAKQQDIIVTDDGMIVGQPVVITDEYGNIIGQEMAPVSVTPTVIQDGVVVDGNPVVIQDSVASVDMSGNVVVNSGMGMNNLNSMNSMNSLNMTGGMMVNSGMDMNSGMGMNSMNMTGGMNSMNMTGGMMSMNMSGGMNMN